MGITPERWQKVQELYHAALEVDPGRRSDFLKEACREDTAIGREVEALLASHGKAGSYLETPALKLAAQAVAETPSTSLVGKTLGAYQVVSLLGSGGMGEVYLARDTKLRREVAIKVLPSIFAQNPERVTRFLREARMLAALTHPNIAAIYGLEEFDGVRYLVLELAPGETLSERIAANRLTLKEALRICAQIAEGLEAAHENGVIHRDLKPA